VAGVMYSCKHIHSVLLEGEEIGGRKLRGGMPWGKLQRKSQPPLRKKLALE